MGCSKGVIPWGGRRIKKKHTHKHKRNVLTLVQRSTQTKLAQHLRTGANVRCPNRCVHIGFRLVSVFASGFTQVCTRTRARARIHKQTNPLTHTHTPKEDDTGVHTVASADSVTLCLSHITDWLDWSAACDFCASRRTNRTTGILQLRHAPSRSRARAHKHTHTHTLTHTEAETQKR